MSDASNAEEAAALGLVRRYYADQLLEKVKEATAAQTAVLAAAEKVEEFERTGALPDPREALMIAVRAGSLVIRTDVSDIRAGGASWEAGDTARANRMALLRWLLAHGYDIGEVFAGEVADEEKT